MNLEVKTNKFKNYFLEEKNHCLITRFHASMRSISKKELKQEKEDKSQEKFKILLLSYACISIDQKNDSWFHNTIF